MVCSIYLNLGYCSILGPAADQTPSWIGGTRSFKKNEQLGEPHHLSIYCSISRESENPPLF